MQSGSRRVWDFPQQWFLISGENYGSIADCFKSKWENNKKASGYESWRKYICTLNSCSLFHVFLLFHPSLSLSHLILLLLFFHFMNNSFLIKNWLRLHSTTLLLLVYYVFCARKKGALLCSHWHKILSFFDVIIFSLVLRQLRWVVVVVVGGAKWGNQFLYVHAW
jgi:hypothetical protein